jgi:hypothetical protein
MLVMCFALMTAAPASADIITGNSAFAEGSLSTATDVPVEPSQDDSDVATSYMHGGSHLFDDAGNVLLVITPSQSVDLFEPREKLRGTPSLFPAGVLDGVGAGVPPASLGNVGNQGGGGTSGLVVTPEPSSLLLLGSGVAVLARRLRRARRERISV